MSGKTKKPPRKKAGQGKGRRTLAGEVLDVTECATIFFGGPEQEKLVRSRVDRRLIPFHRWSGRIIFLRSEVADYFKHLPGCSVDEALKNEMTRREG